MDSQDVLFLLYGPWGTKFSPASWLEKAPILTAVSRGRSSYGGQYLSDILLTKVFTAIRRATKITPIRVFLIYILSLVFIGLLIPQDDSRFFGSSDAEASPWTIAANDAGIPVLGHIVNVVLLFGVLSLGGQSIYLASRVLRAASHQRLVPGIFAKADNQGRPVVALIVTGIFGMTISYINLSGRSCRAVAESS